MPHVKHVTVFGKLFLYTDENNETHSVNRRKITSELYRTSRCLLVSVFLLFYIQVRGHTPVMFVGKVSP